MKSQRKYSNHDSNSFILLLRKGRYHDECMDEKIDETSLPEKDNFYSHLNMENITDADYALGKRVCKQFEINNLGEYHALYVKSNTLL